MDERDGQIVPGSTTARNGLHCQRPTRSAQSCSRTCSSLLLAQLRLHGRSRGVACLCACVQWLCAACCGHAPLPRCRPTTRGCWLRTGAVVRWPRRCGCCGGGCRRADCRRSDTAVTRPVRVQLHVCLALHVAQCRVDFTESTNLQVPHARNSAQCETNCRNHPFSTSSFTRCLLDTSTLTAKLRRTAHARSRQRRP